MRLFVFEHVCGGGMAGEHLPGSLLVQGRAMLQAVLQDFVAAGICVTATLDQRLELTGLPDNVTLVGVDDVLSLPAQFDALTQAADLVLVIAPEFDGTLVNWLRRVDALGVPTLNCTWQAAACYSDKLELARLLQQARVPTPPTRPLRNAAELSWPCVVKPRTGAGCLRTHLCRGPFDLTHLPRRDDWIVQPLVPGIATSCSLIVTRDQQYHILPGGIQKMHYGWAMQYLGGQMPLSETLQQRATRLTEKALTITQGLCGFVGLDLILATDPKQDQIIEINPRMTMSYLGLRELLDTNLAALMLGQTQAQPMIAVPGRMVEFDVSGIIRTVMEHQP